MGRPYISYTSYIFAGQTGVFSTPSGPLQPSAASPGVGTGSSLPFRDLPVTFRVSSRGLSGALPRCQRETRKH